jgi:hypothetical protein
MARPPLLDRIAARRGRDPDPGGAKGFSQPLSWSRPDWMDLGASWSTPDREVIGNNFLGYVEGAYKANGPVYSTIAARQAIFSQVRFGWREFNELRPGELFASPELSLLNKPWPGATTIDLLARMEPVASLAGNYYGTKCDDEGRLGIAARGPGLRIVNMRPDWVTILIGSPSKSVLDLRARVIGYLYEPKGSGGAPAPDALILTPDEVCHYAPYPDPEMRFRGMSWLTPVLREIKADKAATTHKDKFFTNGAVLSTVVKFEKDTTKEVFDAFVERFKATHQGEENAYKTLFLGGGADVTIVGADMKSIEFAAVTAAGETRIAAAGGVHPVIIGMSEGLNGSSLNEGNFGAARRMVADKTMRHLWGIASSSLQTLIKPPRDTASLWYDTRDVAFLREDLKDLSEIQSKQARTIRNLVDAGYTPASVTSAVTNEDWSLLEHSGLYSVQLQKPGSGKPGSDPTPPIDDEDKPE